MSVMSASWSVARSDGRDVTIVRRYAPSSAPEVMLTWACARRVEPATRQPAHLDDTTKCILCAACTSSCPVYWSDGSYFGPAAIVNAHRFIFDSRDQGAEDRLDILNDTDGVWRCRTTFNYTDACPRGIQVTKAIQEVKRALLYKRV